MVSVGDAGAVVGDGDLAGLGRDRDCNLRRDLGLLGDIEPVVDQLLHGDERPALGPVTGLNDQLALAAEVEQAAGGEDLADEALWRGGHLRARSRIGAQRFKAGAQGEACVGHRASSHSGTVPGGSGRRRKRWRAPVTVQHRRRPVDRDDLAAVEQHHQAHAVEPRGRAPSWQPNTSRSDQPQRIASAAQRSRKAPVASTIRCQRSGQNPVGGGIVQSAA